MLKVLVSLKIIITIVFLIISSAVYAESLIFPFASYEGEVKKGKAHGVGTFSFSDGSIYEGKVSKNRIHGNGKYTDAQGTVHEGKFRYGVIKIRVDKKTRNIIKIKPETGLETYSEIKGKGNLSNKWFEAEKDSSGTYVLTAKGSKEMQSAEQAMKGGGSGGNDGGGGGGGC